MGRHDEAIRELEKAASLDPLSNGAQAGGSHAQGLEFGGDATNLYLLAYVGNALAYAGDVAGARAILDRMLLESAKRYVPPDRAGVRGNERGRSRVRISGQGAAPA